MNARAQAVWTKTALHVWPERYVLASVSLSNAEEAAPAVERLAAAGIPIVPQCAFLKDHLLVHERDLVAAVAVFESLIAESRASP